MKKVLKPQSQETIKFLLLFTELGAMSSDRKKYLLLLTRLLFGSPKILFAPNNSATQRIIHKVILYAVFQSRTENFVIVCLSIQFCQFLL